MNYSVSDQTNYSNAFRLKDSNSNFTGSGTNGKCSKNYSKESKSNNNNGFAPPLSNQYANSKIKSEKIDDKEESFRSPTLGDHESESERNDKESCKDAIPGFYDGDSCRSSENGTKTNPMSIGSEEALGIECEEEADRMRMSNDTKGSLFIGDIEAYRLNTFSNTSLDNSADMVYRDCDLSMNDE